MNFREDGEFGDGATVLCVPLGPVKWNPIFVWQRGYQADDEGYELIAETWLDQMGHEYTSIEHVALCAVARALGVERFTPLQSR